MTELLRIRDLTVYRGDRRLISGVGFALDEGGFALVQGANGSGKTTLLRTVAGLLEPESGSIRWRSRPIDEERQAYHADLGWFAHRVGFKGELDVAENLAVESGLRGFDAEGIDDALARTGVSRTRNLPFRALSAGQQRRVALARLLLSPASLWLMDEPLTNLDSAGQGLLQECVSRHLETGGACLVASHQDPGSFPGMQRITLG